MNSLPLRVVAALCSGYGRPSSFTDRAPAIARACENMPADTLIDVEVIVVDENEHCPRPCQ